jgi:hypothetical protein
MRTYSTLDNNEKVIEVSKDLEKYINESSSPQEVSNMYKMRAGALGALGFLDDSRKAYHASRTYLEKLRTMMSVITTTAYCILIIPGILIRAKSSLILCVYAL